MRHRMQPAYVLLSLAALLAGCADGDVVPTVSVSGTALLDGKAISTAGYYLLFTTELEGPTKVEVQTDGSFSGDAVVGANVVSLIPPAGVGGAGHGGGAGAITYNTLDVEIKESGNKFELKFSQSGGEPAN